MPALLFMLTILFWGCSQQEATAPHFNDVPGVSDSEILIGSSLALSGHAGYLGTQTLRGALAYINHVNDSGGVHGRTIRIIAKDDKYDPPRCLVNTQKLLVDHNVFCLFSYVGTPTTVKVLPLIEDARVPLVGMFTGANALREPFKRYLINVRPSYYQETDAAVKHIVEDLGITRIAIFYQYDAYGFDGLTGTELALQKYDLTPVGRASYVRGTLDVADGLKKIMQTGPEAVFMIGTYDPCAEFIKLAKLQDYRPLFYMVSFVGADELARRLGQENEQGVIMSQVVPPPEAVDPDAQYQAAAAYIRHLKTYFPDDTPNFVGFEGYINAQVLVEGLKRAGRDIDREKFIDAIQSIRDFSIGFDNTLSFSPTNHQGLEQVFFTRLENGRFVLITDWQAFKADLRDYITPLLNSSGTP